jgi:hypothetical protein
MGRSRLLTESIIRRAQKEATLRTAMYEVLVQVLWRFGFGKVPGYICAKWELLINEHANVETPCLPSRISTYASLSATTSMQNSRSG